VRAIHTPGIAPSTGVRARRQARGDTPWAVLSSDSLFAGDIARPDLAIEKAAGAGDIFRSLHQRLLTLPETCEVWPGHLGGSLCGGPGMDRSSTIGCARAGVGHIALVSGDDRAAARRGARWRRPRSRWSPGRPRRLGVHQSELSRVVARQEPSRAGASFPRGSALTAADQAPRSLGLSPTWRARRAPRGQARGCSEGHGD
jgi:hypothetical protein